MSENKNIKNDDVKIENTSCHCRKCMKNLPSENFFDAVDGGLVDASGKLSVCKQCCQNLYDLFFEETQSIEKALHKMCITLNIVYLNEAVDATKTQVQTMMEGGKKVTAVFGIFKSKLLSVNKSMDKKLDTDLTYTDISTVYLEKQDTTKKLPIPKELVDFWGDNLERDDILYLEKEYTKFRATHKADTRTEVVLLQQVCYTLLDIKRLRANHDDTQKEIKQLQELMKNLAISPNAISSTNASGKGNESFGLWVQDIEREEPAQWLKHDPRADMFRDVPNVEDYFQKYFVRPLKNLITTSKDFNIDDDEITVENGDVFIPDEEEDG